MLFIRRISPFQFVLALAITALLLAGGALFLFFQDHREKAAITSEDVFIALSQGDMTRITFCLKAKPELANARDKNGRAPLHIAAEKNMADTALLLLNMGADPALKDQEGKTAADIAKEKGANSVSAVLRGKAEGK
ncbi:hypothetical protein AUK22_05620 [bacterium CG2_30_54_10]|nr:MAG: hypothetical protein AUK22_05620 [bacterium CG2_30_54_10]